MLRRCSSCKVEKDIGEFGKNKATKDGLQPRCRPCAREAGRKAKLKQLATPEGREKIRKANQKTGQRLVTDPATGETITASALKGRMCRATPEGLEKSRAASREFRRKLVTDPATGILVTYGALKAKKLVTDPATGETITAGARSKRRLVTDPSTGELITASALASRKNVATEEGREKSRKATRELYQKLVTDFNTGELLTYGALIMRKRRATEAGLMSCKMSVQKYIASGKAAEYQQNRRIQDPLFKLRQGITCLIRNSFKAKGWSKATKTHQMLGCSHEEFSKHLGPKPEDAHIDHILPCSCATDEIELLALQHYSNLQYLPAKENLSKSDTLPDNWEELKQNLLDLLWYREGMGEINLTEYLE